MPSESEAAGAPPVPSVWRLVWLFFMQPRELQLLCDATVMGTDRSLGRLWRLVRAGDPGARALIGRAVLSLLVILPLVVAMTAAALASLSISEDARRAAVGIVVPVAIGIVAAAVRGVTKNRTIGTASVALLAVAYAALFAIVSGPPFDALPGIAAGAGLGGLLNVALVVVTGAGPGLIVGLILGTATGVAFSVMGGLSFGASFGASFGLAVVRLPLWCAEASLTQLLRWRMEHRPEAVARLAAWLPFRHHELIYLPLPGLRACLIQAGEVDPALGKDLIALASSSLAQRSIARDALIELQARDLERVARDRRFARAAGLDLPFLPAEADLVSEPANAPFLSFQTAARDLIAGSTNQRQRRLALDRARRALESFSITATVTSRPTPLTVRLWGTAELWLDVIREEADKLSREVAEHPEVPSVFIAGPPLSPDRAEDRTLFKGRGDVIKLIEHDLAPDRRGILLVVGQRRMGKTSLCNYLPTYLGTGTTVIVSNFQPLSGDAHREAPHRRVLGDIAARMRGTPTPPGSDRWGDGLCWLEELDATCADRKLLVVIDEIERVEDGIRDGWCSPDFLDFLRAAGDALRHIRFLLMTAYPLHRLGPHWTDRLVSVTSRMLSYLGEDDARDLLTRPIPDFPAIYPDGGVDLVVAQTGRHPYLLQKAGDDLCRLLNSRGGLRTATRDELIEVFDGMVRDVQVFDEIWRARTEDERATLRRLARSDEPGDLDPAAIQLAREDYLVRCGDKVSFAVPLFREWIRMNAVS